MATDVRTGVVLPEAMYATLGEALEGFATEEAGQISHLALVAYIAPAEGVDGRWRFRVIGPTDADAVELVSFLRAAAEVLEKRAAVLEQSPPVIAQ